MSEEMSNLEIAEEWASIYGFSVAFVGERHATFFMRGDDGMSTYVVCAIVSGRPLEADSLSREEFLALSTNAVAVIGKQVVPLVSAYTPDSVKISTGYHDSCPEVSTVVDCTGVPVARGLAEIAAELEVGLPDELRGFDWGCIVSGDVPLTRWEFVETSVGKLCVLVHGKRGRAEVATHLSKLELLTLAAKFVRVAGEMK